MLLIIEVKLTQKKRKEIENMQKILTNLSVYILLYLK